MRVDLGLQCLHFQYAFFFRIALGQSDQMLYSVHQTVEVVGQITSCGNDLHVIDAMVSEHLFCNFCSCASI